ncbi:hypothetical protein PanWU01x14_344590, partial [Parasponia andersonii]
AFYQTSALQLQHRERTSRTIAFVPKLDLRIWVCTKDVATEWGQDFMISRFRGIGRRRQ